MKRIGLMAGMVVLAVVIAMVAALGNLHAVESKTLLELTESVAVPTESALTEIKVYVLARGGKFIGDDIGGAQVTLRDAQTREFLASGVTHGSAGPNTLMTVERARSTPLSTEGVAVFTTTLAVDAPRLVEFEAYGPHGAQGASHRVTQAVWVLPPGLGENKILMEIPGLNTDILNPPTHWMPTSKPPLEVDLRVNVTMMCGCPIAPEFPWKPENYTVKAIVTAPDGSAETLDLQFDANALEHAPSQFIGTYTAKQSGVHQVVVIAYQNGIDNTGSDHITFIIP